MMVIGIVLIALAVLAVVAVTQRREPVPEVVAIAPVEPEQEKPPLPPVRPVARSEDELWMIYQDFKREARSWGSLYMRTGDKEARDASVAAKIAADRAEDAWYAVRIKNPEVQRRRELNDRGIYP